MMPIKFRITSNIDLAECRKIFKQYEEKDIQVVVPLRQQLFGPLPARYGFFWKNNDDFILSRWAYTPTKRSGRADYRQKIEMAGRIEGTPDKPEFVIQTKKRAGREMLVLIVAVFIALSAMYGFMTLFATNKVTLKMWMFFEITPLVLNLIYVLGFLRNMFLCKRFLRRLVNPKDSSYPSVVSSR